MTGDFWSIHAALPPFAARRHYMALARRHWAHVEPTGRQWICEGSAKHQERFEAVEISLERYLAIEDLSLACEVVKSESAALLSIIDRKIALPRGISLLDGQALAWLPPERVGRLALAWQRLLDESGGPQGIADQVRGSLADHERPSVSVANEIAAFERALDVALAHDLDLLLICSPSP